MTSTLLVQLAIVGIVGVLVGYAIPALIQVRRTARAVEALVRDATPHLIAATSNLDSILGRTDRVIEGMEHGARGLTGAISGINSFIGHLKVPMKSIPRGPAAMAAFASFLSGMWQAWAAFGKKERPAAAGAGTEVPPEPKGGNNDVR
ncbi:MAG TPA: DUF948 domain-containing protein [Candidatus Saccharimonadales bacterium]|nr:DUF948 domain-containing protein [Candidatus Saccharimonadales bacterium]